MYFSKKYSSLFFLMLCRFVSFLHAMFDITRCYVSFSKKYSTSFLVVISYIFIKVFFQIFMPAYPFFLFSVLFPATHGIKHLFHSFNSFLDLYHCKDIYVCSCFLFVPCPAFIRLYTLIKHLNLVPNPSLYHTSDKTSCLYVSYVMYPQ